MRYFKRLKIYKDYSGNNTFNPETLDAHSYGWWRYLAKVDGKLVFNNYRYSVTTGKHQSNLSHLLRQLGIEPDISMPLPKGIPTDTSLENLILAAEEHLCDQIGVDILKRQEAYQRQKKRKLQKKLENYLDTEVNFRDYEVKEKSRFGSYNKIAVHQCIDAESLENDVNNALHSFHRDGFGSVVFYI